ncbi:MAG TPA: DUF1330 domain-containing protein [Burkholderiales bacterium]|jgi:uncharacterized protein (DUF1330 family)|nr:DUF1330 domain-containing protein [Burkholderiales bacterium]
MPAYLVSIVTVQDSKQYMEYATRANQAAAKYGGRFLLRGAPLEMLEGRAPGERVVVSEWPSVEQARAYYRSPEYAEAKAHRDGIAHASIMLFEGVAP